MAADLQAPPTPRALDRTRRVLGRFTPTWMTALAVASVAIPFVVAIVRLLAASDRGVTLNSDLALLDLHTRDALRWQQLLGPFDRFGWSHPGPTYYYLLTIPYRVLGSGPKALFVGAVLLNALAALGTVWVVRRRGGAAHALWAAVCLGALAFQLSPGGVANTTQSEGPLGIVLSPWNPCIVVFPLLLFVVLCAAAPNRSPLSLVGALLVGSFVVQTNISTAVIVVVLFAASAVTTAVLAVRRRRRDVAQRSMPGDSTDGGDGPAGGDGMPEGSTGWRRWWPGRPALVDGTDDRRPRWRSTRMRGRGWGILGAAVFVAMWVPPLVEQVQDQPGNLTALYRFFTTHQPGRTPDLHQSLWAVFEVDNMLRVGPTGPHAVFGGNPVWTGVMTFVIGSPPPNQLVAAWVTVIVALLLAVTAVVVGIRLRRWFPVALGGLSLVGGLAAVLSASRVVEPLYGYLLSWEVAVPAAGIVAVGGLFGPARARPAGRSTVDLAVRAGLGVLAVVVAVVLTVRFLDLPPVSAASDPRVGAIARLVEPHLAPGETVAVNWSGDNLFDTGTFLGVVVDLADSGYQPRVNASWRAQFGSQLTSTTATGLTRVELSVWDRGSPSLPGYVGRVGDMAVRVLSPGH